MKKLLAVMTGFFFAAMGTAQAAIVAADIDPIVTEVTNTIGVVLPKALLVLAAIVGAVIGFKVIKRLLSASA